jgi:hypothetical protein
LWNSFSLSVRREVSVGRFRDESLSSLRQSENEGNA